MAGDTQNCSNCGDSCGNTGCTNPCSVGPGNTPQCESLPSQIQNFTDQFFGVVVKTMVNGEVKWSLPCGLDVGLPANPRGADEGLACYFLRLFADGITGQAGVPGAPGTPGTAGKNAYASITQPFAQPSLVSPMTQIVIVANPAIVEGLYVFIQHSGYYLVTDVQPGGIIFVTMVAVASPALAVIPVGASVIPTGPPMP